MSARAGPTMAEPVSWAIINRRNWVGRPAVIGRSASMKNGVVHVRPQQDSNLCPRPSEGCAHPLSLVTLVWRPGFDPRHLGTDRNRHQIGRQRHIHSVATLLIPADAFA